VGQVLFPAFMVDHEKTSHARPIAEQDKAQPLIDATGRIPSRQRIFLTTLAALNPKYHSPSAEPHGFLYSAYSSDQLTNGFRNYELQSEKVSLRFELTPHRPVGILRIGAQPMEPWLVFSQPSRV
jgi:hypothetical protein